MEIVTNHHWRPILNWYDLTEKEQAEFDYFNPDNEAGNFVRYRNWVYDLNEFTVNAPKPWDAMYTDTFFSAVICRISEDCENVQMGMLFSRG